MRIAPVTTQRVGLGRSDVVATREPTSRHFVLQTFVPLMSALGRKRTLRLFSLPQSMRPQRDERGTARHRLFIDA